MKIGLRKLALENFKGVESFTLAADGKSCVIQGNNGVGKTTLMDGFLWLLFGKDSQGKADFAIKTLDKNGQEIHNLNHSVEAVLEINDHPKTLKKVFSEKWTKKRGTPRPTFSGHTTDHFIDGVPVQKKEWDDRIGTIIDEATFKLLTSPTYFNSLHWQKRRDILIQVCGDVSDADVIASDKGLAELPTIIGPRSFEEERKVIDRKRREINDRLREIPARIDELTKSVADVSKYDSEAIDAKIKDLEAKIQGARDDTALVDLRKQKANFEAKIVEARAEWKKGRAQDEAKLTDAINLWQNAIAVLQGSRERTTAEINRISDEIQANEAQMVTLRYQFEKVKNQEFKGATICPACGQNLPEERIEEAIANHNKEKAAALEDINRRGRKLKNTNEDTLGTTLKLLEKKKADVEERTKAAELELKTAKEAQAAYIEKWDGAEAREVGGLQAKLADITARMNDVTPVDTKPLEADLKAEQAKLAEIEAAKKSTARILALTEEEKHLARAFEDLERQIYLMEKFIITKVGLLESQINSKFRLARFKLFDTQVNGGISETCVTLYGGVPYGAGLNTGAEINVGLDIIKTLSEHYGVSAPVWIDHAESVTEILNPGSQTIKLAVDAGREKLEVSYE